ncbi:MAG: hypothetical protein PHR22_02025 [Candidatus Omnitrophica bacterium]|nr:hypothetical protein [Candidatus Omnitrophota bacterium]
MNINKILAKEGLIIIGLALVLYAILHFLPEMPVVYPKYKLEFVNGETYTIKIHPEIRNGLNSSEIIQATLNPPPKVIEERIKEFTEAAHIKSKLKSIAYVNSAAVRCYRLFFSFFGKFFVLKILIVYSILLLIRFIIWSLRTLKGR